MPSSTRGKDRDTFNVLYPGQRKRTGKRATVHAAPLPELASRLAPLTGLATKVGKSLDWIVRGNRD